MVLFNIPCGQKRPQGIEIFLIPHQITLKVLLISVPCCSIVVIQGGFDGEIISGCCVNLLPCRPDGVNDGRIGPFKQGGVPLLKLNQGFFQVPPVDIQHLIQLPFNNIPGAVQTQIIFRGPHINKAHIVIAVRGSKAPGPASRFYCQENLNSSLRFNLIQLLFNFFSDILRHPYTSKACRFTYSTNSSTTFKSGWSGRILSLAARSRRLS